MMELEQMNELARLLTLFRDESADRSEYDRRNDVLFEVEFEIEANE